MTASWSMPARPDEGAWHRDETIAVAPETTNHGDGPTFAELGLPKPLTSALARTGIIAPFAIQTATIPDALAGRDVLARARTGSGKTLAFGLPMLARLADAGPARSRRPLALVLVPTRELAMQVHDALEPLAHSLQVKLKLVAGGLSMSHQMSALQAGVHLVVATPGRLADLVRRGNCDLHDVRITVIDEADHMADMGFLPEVSAILEDTVPTGQRLLFSATLDGDVDTLIRRFMHDPVRHSIVASEEAVATMEHLVLQVPPNAKYQTAARIAAREGRTLVFVRTKLAADRVAAQLREAGVLACSLHGGKSQHERNSVLESFQHGTVPVLPAPDVAARAAPGPGQRGRLVLRVRRHLEDQVLHRGDGLFARHDRVADGVVHEAADQGVDVAVESGREEQPLTGRNGVLENRAHLRQEAHVGHVVGLVDDGDPDVVKIAVPSPDKIGEGTAIFTTSGSPSSTRPTTWPTWASCRR